MSIIVSFRLKRNSTEGTLMTSDNRPAGKEIKKKEVFRFKVKNTKFIKKKSSKKDVLSLIN